MSPRSPAARTVIDLGPLVGAGDLLEAEGHAGQGHGLDEQGEWAVSRCLAEGPGAQPERDEDVDDV